MISSKNKYVKSIIFVLLLAFLLITYCKIMNFKSSDGIYQMRKFYDEKDNTIDVLFLGSSHMFVNANTNVLWEDYGIASYDLCASIQPFWNTYYYLKEAYKTQSPKLVVFDIYTAAEMTYDYAPYEFVIKNTYGMKFSKDKIAAIDASVVEGDRDCYYWEMPTFHKRYSELTENDFYCDYYGDWAKHNCYKGEVVFTTPHEIDRPDDILVNDTMVGDITAKNEEYLRKIIELAKSHGSQIVLTLNPYQIKEGQMPIFNRIAEIASEYGVEYVNYNLQYDDIGIDFANDYTDDCHMTYAGSEKFTRFMADNLLSRYDIPDKRGVKGYESYDDMVLAYAKATEGGSITEPTNLQ